MFTPVSSQTTTRIPSNFFLRSKLAKDPTFLPLKIPPSNHQPRPFKIRASSSFTTQESSILDNKNHNVDDNKKAKKKLGVVVERPRLVLKFIWMEKNIGIALDQVIAGGRGTVPLSPYYFWPRKDAWEELKVLLESKPWISHKQTVVLLNQATDIINLWQQSGGNLYQ
ncbi:30S ribosomal protein 3-1, chloroplastic-like [Dorcoceras hygrometricum]|nr:30S ribosomal protein 3-1, chloroplastic-like [Dorcoceras hygrometricum]